jgi:hypothetical protein
MSFVLMSTRVHAQDFTRITSGPVVNDDRYSEGSSWADINNDTFLDVFVPHAYDDRSNLLFINNGDGTFTQVTDGPVVTDISTSSGCSFGDFNNDGHVDLFVQNWNGRDSHLYMNDGDGTFTKITSGIIVNDGGWSFNSSTVDYDNDGNLDIYVDNGAFTTVGENNFLYNGNGDGTFTKITDGDVVNDGEHCLSSSWCDYDNDGDQDLFTANSDPFDGIPLNNFLYENNGDGTFTKLTTGVVVNDNSISVGGSWGDYDNDGDFDLFVANWYGEDNHLYRNDGDGDFTQITTGDIVNDGGNSVSGAWGDYDNDSNLDLYVTNDWNENNYLYRNNGDGTFARITEGDIVSNGGRSNGATWIDYNNDGFLDMFVPNGQIPDQSNFLYRNNGVSGNNWINIRCVGTTSNASAIGTRVRAQGVVASQIVRQLREVSGHQGFNAQESFNVEFGFGQATVVDSLIFEWPSGTIDVYSDVDVNRFYAAIEGEGLQVVVSSVGDEGDDNMTIGPALIQNHPNPFKPSTAILFEITGASDARHHVNLTVHDATGRRVKTLLDAEMVSGKQRIVWDGEDYKGMRVASGIYLYSLRYGDEVFTGKMTLLK